MDYFEVTVSNYNGKKCCDFLNHVVELFELTMLTNFVDNGLIECYIITDLESVIGIFKFKKLEYNKRRMENLCFNNSFYNFKYESISEFEFNTSVGSFFSHDCDHLCKYSNINGIDKEYYPVKKKIETTPNRFNSLYSYSESESESDTGSE